MCLAQGVTMRHSSPKKLMLLTTTSEIAGTPRITINLAVAFRTRGWKVQYVFPYPPGKAARAWYGRQGIEGAVSVIAPEGWLKHTLAGQLALLRFIRRYRPDVVNLHSGDNSISLKDVLVVRLAGVRRCIITIQHPTPLESTAPRKRRQATVAALLADAVVVSGRTVREYLVASGIPFRKIAVIPHGVNPPTQRRARAEVRERFGVGPQDFVIGVVTRLVPLKGVADLIAAAASMDDPEGALRVLIVGEGPERERLETLVRDRLGPRATLLGHVPDEEEFYAALDVFALPSYMEGFGLVYIEAAFYGVPSVGTDVGGVPDAVAHGETGLLIQPGDIQALALALTRLRDDPALRTRLGEAARTRALSTFTVEAMATRYEQVYRSRRYTRQGH